MPNSCCWLTDWLKLFPNMFHSSPLHQLEWEWLWDMSKEKCYKSHSIVEGNVTEKEKQSLKALKKTWRKHCLTWSEWISNLKNPSCVFLLEVSIFKKEKIRTESCGNHPQQHKEACFLLQQPTSRELSIWHLLFANKYLVLQLCSTNKTVLWSFCLAWLD